MPEAPDLQVIKEVLQRKLVGQAVTAVRVIKPTVLRSMATQNFATDIAGLSFGAIDRKGKFLILTLSGKRLLVINPMLTGGLQYCPSSEKLLKKVCIVLSLDSGMELRYFDETQMGKVYYITPDQLLLVPRFSEQGPDVLDESLTLEEFCQRLKRFHGEIKGILTNGQVVSGIGNAHADEILFVATIYPFRKRRTLSQDELARLHTSLYNVPRKAVAVLRQRVGEDIHLKIRDFLRVHGKGGQPCPKCGNIITTISANQRVTNYCRHCQPGMLVAR